MNELNDKHIVKLLKLIFLLTGNRAYTREELEEKLGISKSAFYRALKNLEDVGLEVNLVNGYYRANRNVYPFKDIKAVFHFTEEESYILNQVIHNIEQTNKTKTELYAKLSQLFNSDRVGIDFVPNQALPVVQKLIEAAERKLQVRIVNYRTNSDKTVPDRIVEPFEFQENYTIIWAFEHASEANKMFKTSRISEIEVLNEPWKFKKLHKAKLKDCFRMTGDLNMEVSMRLSRKAANLLKEEYPLSEKFLTPFEADWYIFRTHIKSYEGIGRFLMGLSEDVYDITPMELRNYLKKRVSKINFDK